MPYMLNFFVERQHPGIQLRYHLGTFYQLVFDVLRCVTLEFVVDLVL